MEVQRSETVIVIGGGLAGSEAAWQLAWRGFKVRLYEMRPKSNTPRTTLRSSEAGLQQFPGGEKPTTPAGILKSELKLLNSLIMECAQKSRVPAGNALAVDRDVFARLVDSSVSSHPNIEVIRKR